MLGPEANQYVLVSHPENFHWREGSFGDLIPLLGDGLLTIDAGYHDRQRAIMMPAFHREQIEAAVAAMEAETLAAIAALEPGGEVDVYALDADPRDADRDAGAARPRPGRLRPRRGGRRALRERALLLRNRVPPPSAARPGLAVAAADALAGRPRRDRPHRDRAGAAATPTPDALDILSLLLEARDEDGRGLTDERGPRPGDDADVRRSRHLDLDGLVPAPRARPGTARARRAPRGAGPRARRQRRRPPSSSSASSRTSTWSSTRSSASTRRPGSGRGGRSATSSSPGDTVPAGAHVNYCSWASHRIPEVFPDPEAFMPERFERERKAALPRGAYVPFGAGRRICIGKRFGQTEVKLVADAAAPAAAVREPSRADDGDPPDADPEPGRRLADARPRARCSRRLAPRAARPSWGIAGTRSKRVPSRSSE